MLYSHLMKMFYQNLSTHNYTENRLKNKAAPNLGPCSTKIPHIYPLVKFSEIMVFAISFWNAFAS